MDANDINSEITPPHPGANTPDVLPPTPEIVERPSLIKSAWRGTKTGFWCASWIALPISSIALLGGLALTAFGVGTGHGWGLNSVVVGAFWFYLVCIILGVHLGLMIGLVAALIGRILPSPLVSAGRKTGRWKVRLRREPTAVASAPRPRRRLWPWLVGVPVLLILAIAFGTGMYATRQVHHRLTRAIAAADRDDPFWRLNDLLAHRRPVPDAENSALVVAEVIELLPEGWPPSPPPPPGMPSRVPAETLRIYDRIDATPDNVRLDDSTADALRRALESHKEALGLARTVSGYDRGRHEVALGPTLIDTPLNETQAARSVARLLSGDAMIRTHDGDLDGSLDSCRALLGVGRSIGDEPFLISFLVRAAIGGVTTKAARRALAQGEPSDAALARLQSLLLDEMSRPSLLHGMEGERAIQAEVIRRLRDAEMSISAISEGGSAGGPVPPVSPWGKLWFDYQRAIALEWMNEAVAIARRPVHERPARWRELQDEVDRVRRSRFGPYAAMIPILLLPAIDAAGSADSRHQADLGATVILLAAERHRRQSGDWPASVAAIDPAFLPNPPLDPFSGRPFLVERRDGQFLVHSIGPNLKDEHGAYEPRRWTTGGPDDVGTRAWDVPRRRQSAVP